MAVGSSALDAPAPTFSGGENSEGRRRPSRLYVMMAKGADESPFSSLQGAMKIDEDDGFREDIFGFTGRVLGGPARAGWRGNEGERSRRGPAGGNGRAGGAGRAPPGGMAGHCTGGQKVVSGMAASWDTTQRADRQQRRPA